MTYDLAIIGGGPAGVAAGVYASRKKLKTVFITYDFNSQSVVSERVENWIGTVAISGNDLAKNLREHLFAYAEDVVDVKEGEKAEQVTKKSDIFHIKTDKNTYEAKTVLIATGSYRRKLEVLGSAEFDNKGLTYCASCDGPMFADQDVVVIGGGNAAFESAAQLLAYAKSVTLINRSDSFKADPKTIEKLLKNPKFKVVTNAIPEKVLGDKFVKGFVYKNSKTDEMVELKVSGIFVEIGLLPNTSMVKDLVTLNKIGQIPVDPKTQASEVKGLWAAGDCTDGLYHQNNIAAGDAVKALEDIYLHIHA